MWTHGERFGTIGAQIDGSAVEITTFRAEQYDPTTRKPHVSFGDDLVPDLARRDFTINAMAVSLHDGALHDPFDGRGDLRRGVLRTPLAPEVSFTDDPLRMLRAARFLPRFGLAAAPGLIGAATALAERLGIVSRERIHGELERLLDVADPGPGFAFLSQCGLVPHILGFPPPVDWLEAIDGIDRLEGRRRRRTALLRPLGVVAAGAVLERLRYSMADRSDTVLAVRLVETLSERGCSDAEVRRLLRDARHDRTLVDDVLAVGEWTGDRAAAELRRHLSSLSATEDLDAVTSPLDGDAVMAALGLAPGPEVGRAMAYLEECRIVRGPLSPDEARSMLREWWHASPRPGGDGGSG
jgi:poly(A) polymerase